MSARGSLFVQTVATLVLVSGIVAALGFTALKDPGAAFLRQDSEALWIGVSRPLSTAATTARLLDLPVVEFSTHFRVDPGAAGFLRVEALRGFELALNGRVLASRPWHEGRWREPLELELPAGLVAAENELRVRVSNPRGPALLRVLGRVGASTLATDESWRAGAVGVAPGRAARADDTRRAPAALAATRAWSQAAGVAVPLASIFATSLVLALFLARPDRSRWVSRGRWLLGFGIACWWLFVLAFRGFQLPPYMGFDGPYHLEYVNFILQHRALPLATDGFQMYHPPLFYVLSALAAIGLGKLSVPLAAALRIVPFLCAAAQVALAYLLARELFPGERQRARIAAVAAALLPVNVYMFCYLSNEPLHGVAAGFTFLVVVRMLLSPSISVSRSAAVGGLLGLAILSKSTSLILIPFVLGFIALKQRVIDRAAPLRAALQLGVSALCIALVGGWYFVRNQIRLGRAVIGNWDLPGSDTTWWQDPGFHTPAYFLRFGGSLERPFFSAFESFWDGIYSSFWGDGFLGGVSAWSARHGLWNDAYMSAVYLLAVPASLLLFFGLGCLTVASFRDPNPRRRAALLFVVCGILVVVSGTIYAALVHPVYSMAKGSYFLTLAAPLSLGFAEGLVRIDSLLLASRSRVPRAIFHAWLALLAIAIVLSYAA